MASKIKYDDISLKVADRGFVLSFVEIRKKPGKQSTSQWDNEIRDYKKEAYNGTEGSKAIARMTELAGLAKQGASGGEVMETAKEG